MKKLHMFVLLSCVSVSIIHADEDRSGFFEGVGNGLKKITVGAGETVANVGTLGAYDRNKKHEEQKHRRTKNKKEYQGTKKRKPIRAHRYLEQPHITLMNDEELMSNKDEQLYIKAMEEEPED